MNINHYSYRVTWSPEDGEHVGLSAELPSLSWLAATPGGLGAVAAEAGISRESLYRTLSPKGNSTLKTLLAVLNAVGMKLSVEPSRHVSA